MFSRSLLLAFKVVVTISLLAFVLSIVALPEIFAVLGSADLLLVGLAVGVIVLDQYLGAIQFKLLTGTLELEFTVGGLFRINMIAAFYQLFLPGSLSGGVARWYMLGNPERRYSHAFSCVLFNRLVENITLIVAGALCWWFSGSPPLGYRVGLLLLVLLLAFSSVYALMFTRLSLPAGALASGAALIGRLPETWVSRLSEIHAQLGRAREFPAHSHAYVFALSLARQAIGILGFFWLAQSIVLPIGALELGWVRSFVQLAAQVPISIAGLGVREGTLLALLPLYGVGPPAAVAFSFLLLARAMLLALGGGLLEARYRLIWGR